MPSQAENENRVTAAKPCEPVHAKEEACASAREASIVLPTEDAMASMNIGNAAIVATLTPEAGMSTHAPSTITRTMPLILPNMSRRKTGIIIARYDYVGSKAHLVPRLMEEGRRRAIDLEVIGCADCVLSESYVAMPIQQKDDAGTEATNGGSEVAINGTNAPEHDDGAIGTSTWSENNAHRRQARQVRRAINRCTVPRQYVSDVSPVIPLHHCVPVSECDVAIIRCDSGHLTSSLAARAQYAYNELNKHRKWHDKWEQVTRLSFSDCMMPRHVLCTSLTPYEDVVQAIGLPFVTKTLRGMGGHGVSLVRDEDDYRHLTDRLGEDELLCEEYISESAGRDLRVFIVRGEAVACMERDGAAGNFRANLAQGGTAKAHGIDDAIRKTSMQAYQQTGLDIIGLDLLLGRDGYVFCETNVTPLLRGIEGATGVNVAGSIMDMVAGDLMNR